jgi:hypothetical protein
VTFLLQDPAAAAFLGAAVFIIVFAAAFAWYVARPFVSWHEDGRPDVHAE